MTKDEFDLVGPSEIAERLGVTPAAVYQWRQRGQLPGPLAVVSGVPVWAWETIKQWSAETGHPKRRGIGSSG